MAIINFNSISGVSTVTATSSVTVGDTFIKDKFVGLGTITTTARNAGVGTAVGSLIYNETVGEVQIYKRNSGWVSIGSTTDPAPSLSGLTATGGVISDYSTPPGAIYRAHIFTSSGAFSVSALSSTLPNNVDIFAIGGGGGGSGGFPGYGPGRGGGAGGAFVATLYPVSVNTYPISVGAGGVGAKTGPASTPFASGRGSSGGNSTFTNPSPQVLTAAGGGGGGDYDAPSAVAPVSTGGPGGCGGGGGGYPGAPAPNIAGGTATQPSQNPGVSNLTNYGFAGGTGDNTTAGGGGAGGGTGGIGDNYGPPTNTLRAGGPGIPITYAYGPTTPETYGVGGPTGGPNTGPTVNATYSTGNGGMGWLTNPSPSKGGNGGSGIVVVRYQIGTSQTGTAKATGGAISYYGGKTIHTFTSSGFFENTSGSPLTVDQIIVAGGGGGGGQRGGGGGAGGVRTSIPGLMPATADSQTVVSPGSPNKITVTIGGGGSGGVAPGSNPGVSGSPSVFGPLTATGGGYGGGDAPGLPGATGGSAGSSAAWNDLTSAINSSPNTDSTRQGYPSGSNSGLNGPRYGAGGGGGAGGAGGNGTTTAAGYGGVGVQLPSAFRDPAQVIGAPGPNGGGYWIAGGGGGGIYNPGGNPAGKGGGPGGPYAGGGNGGDENTTGSSGISNTGAGGGGGWNGDNPPARFGGSGGSGLVLVIYPS